MYPGIQSLAHFQSQFYAHILSLNVTNEHDMYTPTVSGLNCSATPISIGWEVQGTRAAPANIDRQATSNGNIWATGATHATPVMIACFTSRLEISAGRQSLTFTWAIKKKCLIIFHNNILSKYYYIMFDEYKAPTKYMTYDSSSL